MKGVASIANRRSNISPLTIHKYRAEAQSGDNELHGQEDT